jgi:hypothetical protein
LHVFEETKDPSELKKFTIEWAAELSGSETIASQVVTFVEAAGTTSPTESHDSTNSYVWLDGGTHRGQAVFTVKMVKSTGESIERAFAVNIVDTVIGTETSEIDRLKALRIVLQDAQLNAVGGGVQEVWNGRYGNKMKYVTMTYDQIKTALEDVNRMISAEERVAAGGIRRGHTALVWCH